MHPVLYFYFGNFRPQTVAILSDIFYIQYTISDIHTPISEMEGDLNEHAHTFFKAAHDEYRSYCREIEELLQQLGDNFRAKADEETLTDYLNTLCSAAIQ